MVRKFSLPIFLLFLKRESHVPIKDEKLGVQKNNWNKNMDAICFAIS